MSGSDLAPFVAAVLNDRTVAGMIQENNELKSKLNDRDNERLLVEVTGQHGSPIYYEESFKNAERYRDDEIVLRFNNGSAIDLTTDGLPLSSLDEIEIRLGGVVVQRFSVDDLNIQFYDDFYDEENRMEYIHIHGPNGSGPIACVRGIIGPLPLGWGQRHADGDMDLTDLLEEVADENNDLTPQTLIINGLSFREKDITGIMSFIKK
ncbi:hypothetical protein FRACYDRAFT_264895 [Fragilariopsis cylindrus CCMP1102]|uniref:Uncharacterized protein n=1 Tax=Fragilariopsis cylindrus CCMP1102 TaxID=635003 RepID=A0A1E7EP69_9STRA|nr:hypothetical protein FRACYDRAFT_264895 [Fragilariopsis cylindrus CCMP1102]|eukprot:OEU07567.1 hypothetical protein FRACYDRAFT_264895 [Fragilariopsis cylindrus CCMP1102]